MHVRSSSSTPVTKSLPLFLPSLPMHIIQEEIGLPVLSSQQGTKGDDNHVVFTIGPLPPGYGMTLGNALRRVLLSSLPGAAVTSLRMSGVQHEYTTVKGMRESVVDIVLNLKELKLRKHSKDPEVITLQAKGPKTLTAHDLKLTSDIEVMNPDLELLTLERGASVDMQITVEKGVGYIPATERNKSHNEPGVIHIDAVFSPVEKVRYEVDATRVGQRTNLEKLTLELKTNGSLTAKQALQFASQLLQSYFTYFGSDEQVVATEFMADFSRMTPGAQAGDDDSGGAPVKESYTPIEILNLSPRTLNALINAGVGSIEQLTQCAQATLTNFRGFGEKALDEVRRTLAARGLRLCEDAEE
jgi:DNA-directed RNA polymerase subunit alpha